MALIADRSGGGDAGFITPARRFAKEKIQKHCYYWEKTLKSLQKRDDKGKGTSIMGSVAQGGKEGQQKKEGGVKGRK